MESGQRYARIRLLEFSCQTQTQPRAGFIAAGRPCHWVWVYGSAWVATLLKTLRFGVWRIRPYGKVKSNPQPKSAGTQIVDSASAGPFGALFAKVSDFICC